MAHVLHCLMHILVALLFPPLLLGVINKTKAWMGGRQGAPIWQPYFELWRLVHKSSVFSRTTTWVFRFGPVVGVATAVISAMLIPVGTDRAPLHFMGDAILLAYLLGLARFFTMAAALDTGSAFEGMGAAREATFSCLAEPALFFGFLVLARVTGHLDLSGMLGGSLTTEWGIGASSLLLVLVSWFLVLLSENSRIPVDDPETHLELTMIHEVMVLDHSGPAFALILYGAAVKLFVFSALVVRLAVPIETGWGVLDWGLAIVSLLVLAVLIGLVESIMARLRLVLIPNLLAVAGVLSAFGFVLLLN